MNMTLKKLSALLGVVAVIGVAGCADRNGNGQPDSAATPGEIAKSVDKAGDAAGNAVSGATGAMKNVDDAAMTPKIKTALGANAALAGSNINVDSKDSGVTLSGTVKNDAQKTLAEKIAKQNAPTYKITNNLKVSGGASPMMGKPAAKKGS